MTTRTLPIPIPAACTPSPVANCHTSEETPNAEEESTNETAAAKHFQEMDEDLIHVCTEPWIPVMSREIRELLKQVGIFTIEHLLKAADSLRQPHFAGLEDENREDILVVIDWIKTRREETNGELNLLKEFDGKKFLAHKQNMYWKNIQYVSDYLGKGVVDDQGENMFSLYEYKSGKRNLNEISKWCAGEIMKSSNHLKSSVGKFDHEKFIMSLIDHFHCVYGKNLGYITDASEEKHVVLQGHTQSGKSAVKGVIQALCQKMCIPLIIVTKGVDESIDLHSKLMNFSDVQNNIVVVSRKMDKESKTNKKKNIQTALRTGGVVVTADTVPQIKKVCDALQEYREKTNIKGKFLLVIDEADAMLWRTDDGTQCFEEALNQLRSLGPSVTAYISATPVPILKRLQQTLKDDDIKIFKLAPGDNYVGLESTETLKSNNGRDPIFLKSNELNINTSFHGIPYTNEKVMALYNDALFDTDGCKKGTLLLDITCPRVYTDKNVFQKAEKVQAYYKRRKQNIVVIAFVGSGISVKLPNSNWEKEKWRLSLIGDVIKDIDEHEQYGLSMPIFIFGFSKMRRGISFRSNLRAPTHLVMMLSSGHHMSNVIQTLGRASGNSKSVLQENGYQSVKILTTQQDYKIGTSVQCYLDEVASRVNEGETLEEALTGTRKHLPQESNFLRRTYRKLGPLKSTRKEYKSARFEDPEPGLSEEEKVLRGEYWNDSNAQQLIRALVSLRRSHQMVKVDDIIDHFADANESKMATTEMKKLLKAFCQHVWIEKLDKEQDQDQDWYSIDRDLNEFVNVDDTAHPSTENESDEDSTEFISDISNELSSSIRSASSYSSSNEDSDSQTDSKIAGHRKRKSPSTSVEKMKEKQQ